ncbi:MAG: hypothetical protein IPQ07_41835 [Myxococcales bacterium]|nr:hypothetical protein [Myxococcales bacterium]
MGLYRSKFRYASEPPDLKAVYAEAGRRLGGIGGIENLELEGNAVIAYSFMDAFTHPVVCAILEELGGQQVRGAHDEPVASMIPQWAHRPIREMPWHERMAIRYRWVSWLFGTIGHRSAQ